MSIWYQLNSLSFVELIKYPSNGTLNFWMVPSPSSIKATLMSLGKDNIIYFIFASFASLNKVLCWTGGTSVIVILTLRIMLSRRYPETTIHDWMTNFKFGNDMTCSFMYLSSKLMKNPNKLSLMMISLTLNILDIHG